MALKTPTPETRRPVAANNLANLRGKRPVQSVADAAGITRAALYQIESGECLPYLSTAAALAKALGAPVVFTVPPPEK
jgi:DNA-binding XRE family transcriptional regulator